MLFHPKLILVALAAAILGPGAGASVAETQSVAISLDAVEHRVRRHNPHLAAALLRIDEARARLDQAGRLSNPEIASAYRKTSGSGEHSFEVGLSQAFPLTARLRLEKQVSHVEVALAEAEVRDAERKLVADTRLSAVRLLSLQQQIGLRRRQAGVADELASFIEKVYARGEGSALDAGQAKLESRQLALEIRQLEKDTAALLGKLKPTLGLSPEDRLRITGSLPPPGTTKNHPIDPAQRPDYQGALLAIDAAEREIALEKARRFEDVNIGIIGEHAREEDAPVGLENESIIGLRLSIPLPLWNQNRGAIREKTTKRQRVELEAGALANEIRNEAATALAEMRSHVALLHSIDTELLPVADRQVKQSDIAYRNGQAELQSVLRARDQKIKLESARLEALRDYHLARVRYQSAAGITSHAKP